MRPSFENKVKLVVSDFECSPDVISETLEMQASQTWLKGDAVLPQAKNVHHENGWMLRSPADPETSSVESAIEALLNLFPNPSVFHRLPAKSNVQITCTLYGYTQRPSLFVPAGLVSRIANINAGLDIDPYDMTEVVQSE